MYILIAVIIILLFILFVFPIKYKKNSCGCAAGNNPCNCGCAAGAKSCNCKQPTTTEKFASPGYANRIATDTNINQTYGGSDKQFKKDPRFGI